MKRRVTAESNNKNLIIISKILNKNGIEYFPFYGTLLGLVREDSCIDGDDDIDIMVNYKHKEKIYKIMTDLGMKNTDGGRNFLQFTYKIGSTPVVADFYLFEEEKEYIIEKWNFLGKEKNENYNIHYDKENIFPLNNKEWRGITLPMPSKPQVLVEYCYGRKWKEKKDKATEYRQFIVDNKIVVKYKEEERNKDLNKELKTSVILITCDRPSLALQAVKSLYETTNHLAVELVLVVDGLKETVDILENYLKNKVKENWTYKIDYSPTRRGAHFAWNYGLSMTTGDLLFPSGDDQFFHPEWLDLAIKAHQTILGGYGMVGLNDKHPAHADGSLSTTVFYDRKFCIEHLGGVCAFPVYNYFYIDNELNERAKLSNRFIQCRESVVEHMHHGVGKRKKDYLDSERSDKNYMTLDYAIFKKRMSLGFPNDFDPVIEE